MYKYGQKIEPADQPYAMTARDLTAVGVRIYGTADGVGGQFDGDSRYWITMNETDDFELSFGLLGDSMLYTDDYLDIFSVYVGNTPSTGTEIDFLQYISQFSAGKKIECVAPYKMSIQNPFCFIYDEEPRDGETYNGGIALEIKKDGSFDIPISTVTSYQPAWETVSESFEQNDYSTYTVYMGDRFSASISTGILRHEDMQALRNALLAHEFTLMCPEFPDGILVRLTSLSQPLEVANYGRRFYRLTFAVAAVALLNGGSL